MAAYPDLHILPRRWPGMKNTLALVRLLWSRTILAPGGFAPAKLGFELLAKS
jgi:hypothetical protein